MKKPSVLINRRRKEFEKKVGNAFVVLALVLAVFLLCSCGGIVYTCDECGKKVTEAYYDPFNEDTYYCKDCARAYFAPFPYTSYRAR